MGVCFWLVGICPYCEIETTAKIQHRLPDLVVSAFKKPGQNPWVEARAIYGTFAAGALRTILGPLADGSGTILERGEENSDIMFNEVHVIGNPVAYASGLAGSAVGFLCQSQSLPIPYFLSEVDAIAWRDPLSESLHPESYTPGMREIWGMGGSVFPRVGYVKQPDPPMAAAINAQRAIDIVLQNWQVPHLYVPFGFANMSASLSSIVTDPSSLSDSISDTVSSVVGSGSESGEGTDGLWSLAGIDLDPDMLNAFSSVVTTGSIDIGSLPIIGSISLDLGNLDSIGMDNLSSIGFGSLGNYISWLEPGLEGEKAWQMISPRRQNYCESFVDAPLLWSSDKQSRDYTFGWQYWRKYKCCEPHLGAFIGSTEFSPVCLIGSND
ncbi:MAG: TraU family protein [Candidatus Thiodiazotropha sp. (ex Lucinoma borealis)]|nr:TraU family protein [Candidatus Thiodiazotropha sp. (ex Lucinoma borealis)]